jgi:uncharacterized protein
MADMPQTIFVRPPVAAILAAVTIGGLFYVGGKYVETRDREIPMITVSGEGKTSAAPDIASLSFGIQTGRQRTAGEAMTILKGGMDKVLAAVRKEGIAAKDIRSEQFSLNPVYDWSNGRQNLLGYEASQSLRVKVRNLDKVSTVLGAATAAGANQAGDVSFVIDDPEKARSVARAEAITQAKAKAERLAADLGMELGKIKNFNENGGYQPPIAYARGMAAANMDGAQEKQSVEMPAGEQDVNVTVSITYELR